MFAFGFNKGPNTTSALISRLIMINNSSGFLLTTFQSDAAVADLMSSVVANYKQAVGGRPPRYAPAQACKS